jgi:hypothetical protein
MEDAGKNITKSVSKLILERHGFPAQVGKGKTWG